MANRIDDDTIIRRLNEAASGRLHPEGTGRSSFDWWTTEAALVGEATRRGLIRSVAQSPSARRRARRTTERLARQGRD